MPERRISDHQILIVDNPRSEIGDLTARLRDSVASSYVLRLTDCCNCSTNIVTSEPKPVDRDYYRRTFGKCR